MKPISSLLAIILFSVLIVCADARKSRRFGRARRASAARARTRGTTQAMAKTTAGGTSGASYSGDGTWYDVGLGSCGWTNSDSELVAALNAPQMQNGANSNSNPNCGKMIRVVNAANNKAVTVKIVDTCPPCSSGSVDLSPSAFSEIANLSDGRISINWTWA